MRIGSLNKIIDLEAPTKVDDGMGSFTTVWTVVADSIRAAIWTVGATETIRSSAPTIIATHKVRIRYRSVMSPAWRISWAGQYFDIKGIIDPEERHKFLDLLCKESG